MARIDHLERLQQDVEAGASASTYESAVRAFFRPEFFNRLDGVVAFDPLDAPAIRQIVELELRQVAEREGLQRLGVTLTWTPAALDRLAAEGYDPRYGARPLQRTIERLVTVPLARRLLQHPRPTRIAVEEL
ncbi:MAG: hypothetical protein ACYCW6_27555 [Candidatus Xenobia bacterium]